MMVSEKYIYGASSAMWCAYIYCFSADSGTVSGGKSMTIAQMLEQAVRGVITRFVSYNPYDLAFSISHILRKCGHMAEFAVLAVVLALFVRSVSERFRKFIPFVFTVLYAATDELHQMFVPGRGPAVTDVFIDAVGAAIGITVLYMFLKRRKSNAL